MTKHTHKVKVAQSCLTLCDPMDYTSMGFSGSEYWSGQPFPSPGDLPNPGIKPGSPSLQVDYSVLTNVPIPHLMTFLHYEKKEQYMEVNQANYEARSVTHKFG